MFKIAAAMLRGTRTYRVWPHRNSSIDLLNVTKLELADVSILVVTGTLYSRTDYVALQAIAAI